MTILIAASSHDKAALNIADKLIRRHGFQETKKIFDGKPVYTNGEFTLIFPSVDNIYVNNLGKFFNFTEIIFASRHKSETGEPTLTVHVPGNLKSQANYGGRPNEVALANPGRIKALLLALLELGEKLKPNYKISLEATHHGPTELGVPATFVEIGSSEDRWIDQEAGEVVAEAISRALLNPSQSRSAAGFGGGHYAPAHTEITVEQDIAVGHIVPKYALENVNPSMVKEVFQKTINVCNCAVLDWKGIRGDAKGQLLKILEDMGIDVLRV